MCFLGVVMVPKSLESAGFGFLADKSYSGLARDRL
jgi:hypothetical protein